MADLKGLQTVTALPPPPPNMKNQHYVWAHYLNAWAESGSFCCYRQTDGKMLSTKPRAVASGTYFYETQHLTPADRKFLELFIGDKGDERLRRLNLDYIELTQLSFGLRETLKSPDLAETERAELEEQLRWAERNLGEKYHSGIENKCQDLLDALRNGNVDFFDDMVRAGDFIFYLCHQYFRTARMRSGFSRLVSPIPGHDPKRTAGTLLHIVATTVSVSIFKEKRAYRIVLLENQTKIPFITGDQPVVNMLDPRTTNDIELYYPLSPRLAMVLTKDVLKFPQARKHLSAPEVEDYNYSIYDKSEDQLYTDDEGYLSSLVANGRRLLSA